MASIPLRPPGKSILMNQDQLDEFRSALEKTYKARFGYAVKRSLDDLAKSYVAGFESERERTVRLKSEYDPTPIHRLDGAGSVTGVWVDENGHAIDATRYQDTNEPPVVKPVANLTDKPSTQCSETGSW